MSITAELMENLNINKLSGDLLDLLFLLNRKVFNHGEFVKGLSLPPSHIKVIFFLMNYPSLPISQIAYNLGISKPNMTPIIDKLIQDGFVNRYEDSSDRRIIRVEVTEKSKELFKCQSELIRQKIETKILNLSFDDLSLLNNSVECLNCIISKFDNC